MSQLPEKYDLLACRMLYQVTDGDGSWEENFVKELDIDNVTPRQRWFLFNAILKFRRWIMDDELLNHCWQFLLENRHPPISRKEATKILKQAKKAEA